jgi:serine/threonine protein kinase
MIIGKARYMSVEQARGDSAVPQSDLYSLGIIAYELLTGRVPFEGEPMDILARHLKEQPRPVNEVVPGVPERLTRAIMRALEKDASRRFANAEEMARAFGYMQPFNEGAVSQTGAENVMGDGLVMGVDAIRLRNAQNGKVIEVRQSPLILSRDVVGSADPNMSRRHGQLLFRDKLWWVMEIPNEKPSTNGIYRNGIRVSEPEGQFLSTGDEIRLGETLLKVET